MKKVLLAVGFSVGGMAFLMALLVIGVYSSAAGLLGAGSRGGGGQLDRDTVPEEYAELVGYWGNLCPELSPALLAAQLKQESGWNPQAQSHAEAQGIAQFIPGTWAVYGLDANGDGRADVWDPEDAIPSSAHYSCTLAGQLRGVPGDPVDNMLAGYNAGPDAVLRHGGIPPYDETQNYVRIIRDSAEGFALPEAEEEESGAGQEVRLPPSEAAAAVVHYAQDQLGTPYLWGGDGGEEDDGRFDCSGLTKAAYEEVGIELPRVAADQWHAGPHPRRDELLPGDLVFFSPDLDDATRISHVGVYVGGGYMIDAPYTGEVIRFSTVDTPDYFGATRPIEG